MKKLKIKTLTKEKKSVKKKILSKVKDFKEQVLTETKDNKLTNLEPAWLDSETTGLDFKKDRIIELFITYKKDNNTPFIFHNRFKVDVLIKEEASKVNHIYEKDLKDCKPFGFYAKEIYEAIKDRPIGGYNIKFDIIMLYEELKRVGIDWDFTNGKMLDVFLLWKKFEGKKLIDAIKRFYPQEQVEKIQSKLHSAEFDVRATIEIFFKLKNLYFKDDVVPDVDFNFNKPSPSLYKNENGKWTLAFNKYKNNPKTLEFLVNNDISYLNWLVNESQIDNYLKYVISNQIEEHKKVNLQTYKKFENRN
jgi:DNA polymerase III epsilon subunit-like protein